MKTKPSLSLAVYHDGLKSTKGHYQGIYPPKIPSPLQPPNSSRQSDTVPSSRNISRHDRPTIKIIKDVVASANTSPDKREKQNMPRLKLRPSPTSTNINCLNSINLTTLAPETKSTRLVTHNDKDSLGGIEDIENYLKYLDEGSKMELESFRKKIAAKKENGGLKRVNRRRRPSWLDKIITQNSNTNLSTNNAAGRSITLSSTRGRPKLPGLDAQTGSSMQDTNSSRVLQKRTNTLSAIGDTKGDRETPLSFERQFTKKHSFAQLNEDGQLAEELAGDLCKAFKVANEAATMSAESRRRLFQLMAKENMMEIFFSKTRKHLSLFQRIFQDMIEYMEVQPILKTQESKTSSSLSPLKRSPSRKLPKITLLIRDKYQAYKRVKTGLDEMILHYKLQNLNRLEYNLLKAHEDFKLKKQVMLHQLHLKDQVHYNKMKEKFEKFEDTIPVYNYEDLGENIARLERNYGDSIKLDSSKRIVNKGLSDLMNKWTKTVLDYV